MSWSIFTVGPRLSSGTGLLAAVNCAVNIVRHNRGVGASVYGHFVAGRPLSFYCGPDTQDPPRALPGDMILMLWVAPLECWPGAGDYAPGFTLKHDDTPERGA